MALLAGMTHQKATDPALGELLVELKGSDLMADPDSPEAVNVREIARTFDRQVKLPQRLVEELAKVTSNAQSEWVAARSESNFEKFLPWLERIVDLKQQEANCLGDGEAHYDALLDEYEPGARTTELASVFSAIREPLINLVRAIGNSPVKADLSLLHGDFPTDRQKIFGEIVAAAFGFDFTRGRLDTTAHPFCSGIGPGDCRITTRYLPDQFASSLFGIMHETGHALYEQGLDASHYGTPMGESVSLGIHESQSRLWENGVGRSRPFWLHFLPLARQVFPSAFRGKSLDDFHLAINHVAPSPIRVEADEVTYNLHVLIRFELEADLLHGRLKARDVPEAWNEKSRRYLGLDPANDAEGCLQDIHWSAGLFGYFPTYTLGNVCAAQLQAQAEQDLGGLDTLFARGEFRPLLDWLRAKVHRQGRRYHSSRLIESITGTPLDHQPLVRSLESKYSSLYHL